MASQEVRHRKLHADEHEEGGIDEIPQGSLLPQEPTLHASTHESGGDDELNIDAPQIADGSVTNEEFQYLSGVTTYVADKDYVDSAIEGMDWQESVLSIQNTPPSTPDEGDRYLIGESPTDEWDGHDNEIAEYEDGDWVYTSPDDGFAVFVEDEDKAYIYNENSDEWIPFSSIIDHTSLQSLDSDDHTQYLHIDGRRSMTGDLDLDGNDLVDDTATIWDSSNSYIPQNRLENDSLTVTAGTALTGGGSVALGSSTTLDVDESAISHDNLSGGTDDDAHHTAFVGLNDGNDTAVPDSNDEVGVLGGTNISTTQSTNDITIDIDITENLDMNSYDITNVGDVDGIDISTHDHDGDAPNIPNSGLENSSVEIIAGHGLTNGGSVSLGDEISLSVETSDLWHGSLDGLNRNHHPHYLLRNGDNDITGDILPQSSLSYTLGSSDYLFKSVATNEVTSGDNDKLHLYGGDGLELSGGGEDIKIDDHIHGGSYNYSNMGNLDFASERTLDISNGRFKPRITDDSSEPGLSSGEVRFWYDSGNDRLWLICNYGSTNHYVELGGETDTEYSDTSHSDVDHSDISHSNVSHEDTYSDTSHSDEEYSDVPYQDKTFNGDHMDQSHIDSDHSDVAEEDSHGDTAHSDTDYSDLSHSDVSHSDHSDSA